MSETLSVSRMFARLEELAAITDEPGVICRTFLSPAMQRANELVGGWMREIGCAVEVDGWGNLIGHLAGTDPAAKTLLLGSHLDTVRNAGKYDGPLGVLAALEALAAAGTRLPFHIDVLGFSDEEGTRFQSAYLGSKALAGLIDEHDLNLTDRQGITVREAVATFQKTDHLEPPPPRYDPEQLLGYVELHIEQGPILQEMDKPLGVVDFIAAQNRFLYTVKGCAGHAGTTPMKLRRDALTAAAEFILEVEKTAQRTPGLVATVGQLEVGPNVSNVIPDRVQISLDIRHADNDVLHRSSVELQTAARELALRRGLGMEGALVQGTTAVPCAPELVAKLVAAVEHVQDAAAPRLVSGAGHDAVMLSQITPVGMLFVRCQDGLSHHPLESVRQDDAATACAALGTFLRNFA